MKILTRKVTLVYSDMLYSEVCNMVGTWYLPYADKNNTVSIS